MTLPPLLSPKEILKRLQLIFPDGAPQRIYCTRELAASTVFTMLYINAIDGNDVYLSPKHVYKMTDKQARSTDDSSRNKYASEVVIPGYRTKGKTWYADNTRESIRDETLREGFMEVGAVLSKRGLPPTSSKGRYALQKDFAALFDPNLDENSLKQSITLWQSRNLSKSSLARIQLLAAAGLGTEHNVLVQFPNKETRSLSAGLSSEISKAVIEKFSLTFMEKPAILWLSESGKKIVARDDQLANKIGIKIDVSLDLPDIIIADITHNAVLLVFVEVVATDGAITERRKKAIYDITDQAGFDRRNVVFVTAYQDREHAAFKKTFANVAMNTLIWFASHPDHIFIQKEGQISITEINNLLSL